ncbi:MAG: NAD kinase [Saprospiraceae bacterium]|nr:NAD kinase [Saprospiraceae bacterium]
MKILIYGLKIRDEQEVPFITQLIRSAESEKLTIVYFAPYAAELTEAGIITNYVVTVENYEDFLNHQIDIVITLGGDGTILAATTLIRSSGVPILGINLGRLGFLASVEKKYIPKIIKQLLSRKFETESRTLLSLSCKKPMFEEFPYALNDFTLNKRDTSSMITIYVYIDGELLNSYWADGIIISTPTGSTGYSLSCGGPIIFPRSGTFIITPVAPHNLNVRPIVLSDLHKIKLKVHGRTDNFMCTMDSRYETVTSDHEIEISKAGFEIRLVRLPGQSFMKTISEKLMWGLDKRN